MKLAGHQTQHFSDLTIVHWFFGIILEDVWLKAFYCVLGGGFKSIPQLVEMELFFLSQQHTLVKILCFLSHPVNF